MGLYINDCPENISPFLKSIPVLRPSNFLHNVLRKPLPEIFIYMGPCIVNLINNCPTRCELFSLLHFCMKLYNNK